MNYSEILIYTYVFISSTLCVELRLDLTFFQRDIDWQFQEELIY